MTKFGITYLGHEKDTFGIVTVRFQIKNKLYTYELPFYWMEKITLVARNSEPKALNMAKEVGELINTEEVSNGNTKKTVVETGVGVEKRPEAASRSTLSRDGHTHDTGQHLAGRDTSSAILEARNFVQKVRDEGQVDGETV